MTNNGNGFWSFQKKLVAIASTIVIIGAAWVAVVAGGNNAKAMYRDSVARVAIKVADSLDEKLCQKRLPIDSMILCQLKAIRMDQRKTSYMLEKNTNKKTWNSAEASWRSDSIWNEKHPAN
jgi:hypothetical protein